MIGLTIFTSVYNLAYTIPKFYKSLSIQSCRNYEWLVIDGGSIKITNRRLQPYLQTIL